MNTKILPQNFQTEDAFIFDIKNFPAFMYLESRFWINLNPIWQWLGNVERAFSLKSEVRIFMNDRDRGTYIPLDYFISLCPSDVQTQLNEQKSKLIAMMEGSPK